jgi:transcriptional regulator with XRE-family HTH domain
MINLKNYRKTVMDLTQKEVADFCNVSVKTIGRWESDEYQRKPNKKALRKLAGLYNIRVENLKNTIKGIKIVNNKVFKNKIDYLDHIIDELHGLKDDLYYSSQRNEERIDWLVGQCLKVKWHEKNTYDTKEEE